VSLPVYFAYVVLSMVLLVWIVKEKPRPV
jgi:hypothetical protein